VATTAGETTTAVKNGKTTADRPTAERDGPLVAGTTIVVVSTAAKVIAEAGNARGATPVVIVRSVTVRARTGPVPNAVV
jgi:hypothetical protein